MSDSGHPCFTETVLCIASDDPLGDCTYLDTDSYMRLFYLYRTGMKTICCVNKCVRNWNMIARALNWGRFDVGRKVIPMASPETLVTHTARVKSVDMQAFKGACKPSRGHTGLQEYTCFQ